MTEEELADSMSVDDWNARQVKRDAATIAYSRALGEYTAACVELVERLAGDLPFDPSYPKVVCRQIVKNMKPTNPSNTDSIGGE